jgi:membrane protease YdiL (CAAX protease family)
MKSLDDNSSASGESHESLPGIPASRQLPVNSMNNSLGRSLERSVSKRPLPENLRVSWSWPHFALLLSFCWLSLIFLRFSATRLAPHRDLTPEEFRVWGTSRPEIGVGVNLVWYFLILLFLYVTLAAPRASSFWHSLGWRNVLSLHSALTNPWTCFFAGCGLATCIAFLSAQFHSSGEMANPVVENRFSALLFAAMAVFVAPVVEETVFRGYLYPLFAKSFGVGSSIVLTGVLFGIVHGPRLGWDWRSISTFTIVGLVFTLVRAKTGTVVSSFCLHLGYNSVLVFATIVATRGFTQFPPRP